MSDPSVPSEAEIRSVVRRVLLRTLGRGETTASARPKRTVIDQAAVNALDAGSVLDVPPGSLVTPLARDAAQERSITLREGPPSPPAGEAAVQPAVPRPSGARGGSQTVAVGADHGGYGLKEALRAYLEGEGYAVIDCGTDGPASVDYPDYAYAVAQHVSSGRAWRGIIVDGAGIGSCMAANKVPGVRAALCYDQATAVNSREHNDANVLTLGAGLIGENLAKQIASTWLTTPFGGGRHARRVNKIMDIERRFTR